MATGLTKTALTRLPGREAGTDQQASRSLPGPAGGDRHQGNQEERRLRNPRHRPPGEGRAQGPHRPQPADRRGHQDQGQDRGQVPRGQGRQGRDRPCQEVASGLVEYIHLDWRIGRGEECHTSPLCRLLLVERPPAACAARSIECCQWLSLAPAAAPTSPARGHS